MTLTKESSREKSVKPKADSVKKSEINVSSHTDRKGKNTKIGLSLHIPQTLKDNKT